MITCSSAELMRVFRYDLEIQSCLSFSLSLAGCDPGAFSDIAGITKALIELIAQIEPNRQLSIVQSSYPP
jgi:hypothetical protein